MQNLRVAIAGLGRIGQVHLDAWRKTAGCEVVAAYDDAAAAVDLALKQKLSCYEDMAGLLRANDIDILSVCTPPAMHLAATVKALEKGIHVLCEKPLSVNWRGAERMIRASQSSGTKLQMATKFRHVPEIRGARDLIRDGEIGEPMRFQIEFAGPVDMSRRWNSSPTVAGGGVIIDNGSHALDLVKFLFGSINRVQATQLKPLQNLAVEDQALVLVSAGNDVLGEVTLSWSMQPSSDFYLTIHGTKGTIAIGWKASFIRRGSEEPVQIAAGYDKNATHVRMMTEFANLVRGKGKGWVNLDECLTTQAAIEACYASMESGAWAPVETIEPAVAA